MSVPDSPCKNRIVFAPVGSRATGVYSVNLATGAMTLVSNLNNRVRNVVAMAVVTGP